jgi:fructoselysine-6-P-deglycase FrlB-like protein
MVSESKPCGSKNNTNKRISTTTNDHRGTSGVRVTMSKEAALGLKEASGIYSEAIHTSEARRGSKAVMGKKTPIYYNIFAEEDLEDVGKLLRDLEGSGVLIYLITSKEIGEDIGKRSLEWL